MTRFIRVLAFCAGLMPLAATAQTAPAPLSPPESVSEAQKFDAPVENVDPNKPLIPSFLRNSPTRAGGPANELNTGDQRATEKLPGGSVADAVSGRDLYHGNYCGYGNRGYDKPPVDDLDAACMRHDQCFDQTNRSCGCNAALKVDAYKVSEMRSASRELRMRAASVIESIAGMKCRD